MFKDNQKLNRCNKRSGHMPNRYTDDFNIYENRNSFFFMEHHISGC